MIKMNDSYPFRTFLFVVLAGIMFSAGAAPAFAKVEMPAQEFYELRIYQVTDYSKMQIVEAYLKDALLPALGRQQIGRVGVFTNMDDVNDHSLFMLIPFKNFESFSKLSSRLAADKVYQKAASNYFSQPLRDPLYNRIESRFLKAFAGMPIMELPPQSTKKQPRIFELRLYESHTEFHAARKVEMFNDGEIGIMKDAGMGPVFFGETLIGPQQPNLIYMLSGQQP